MGSYTVSEDALLNLVEGINSKQVVRLLRRWGHKIKPGNPKENNAKLIHKYVGNSISNEQLEDLWLLREQHVIFKKLGWRLFELDMRMKKMSPEALEERLNAILKEERLTKTTRCRVYDLGRRSLQYVSFIFKERDNIFESWKSKFKIFKPVWKARCILDYDHSVIRVNAENDNLEVVLNILGTVMGGSLKSIRLPPYILKELAEEDLVTRIVLLSSTEVTGAKGVGRIVLEGKDVMRGVEELRTRQEIDLNKLGVLLEVGTKSLKANVEGIVWTEDENKMNRFLEKFIKSD
ncbi:MAG: hypothetical protein ACFFBS_03615 [Promethearchaeota archaeon]